MIAPAEHFFDTQKKGTTFVVPFCRLSKNPFVGAGAFDGPF